jgi:hypothetical protein
VEEVLEASQAGDSQTAEVAAGDSQTAEVAEFPSGRTGSAYRSEALCGATPRDAPHSLSVLSAVSTSKWPSSARPSRSTTLLQTPVSLNILCLPHAIVNV